MGIKSDQSEDIKDNETETSDSHSDSDNDLLLAYIAIRQEKKDYVWMAQKSGHNQQIQAISMRFLCVSIPI